MGSSRSVGSIKEIKDEKSQFEFSPDTKSDKKSITRPESPIDLEINFKEILQNENIFPKIKTISTID